MYGYTASLPSSHTCKTEERLHSLFLMSMKDLAIFQTEKESRTLFSYPPAFLFRLDVVSAKLHNFHHISNTLGILFYIFLHFLVSNSFRSRLTLRSGERMTGGERVNFICKNTYYISLLQFFFESFWFKPLFCTKYGLFWHKKRKWRLKVTASKISTIINTVESKKVTT